MIWIQPKRRKWHISHTEVLEVCLYACVCIFIYIGRKILIIQFLVSRYASFNIYVLYCSRASDYGLMKIDNTGRIIQFSEKPKGPDLKAMVGKLTSFCVFDLISVFFLRHFFPWNQFITVFMPIVVPADTPHLLSDIGYCLSHMHCSKLTPLF